MTHDDENNDMKSRITLVQQSRDAEDDIFWTKTWWGDAAKTHNRRTELLDDCKITLSSGKGKFSVLEFSVLDGRQTVYGVQRYYLRNQWNSEDEAQPDKSYWYDDAGSSWMQGVFDGKEFTDRLDVNGDLYKNASDEQKKYEVDLVGVIRPFTKEEKDLVAEVVLPFIRQVDEICSGEGKNAKDFGIDVENSRELTGVDRTLKLNMFKALMLLSENCN